MMRALDFPSQLSVRLLPLSLLEAVRHNYTGVFARDRRFFLALGRWPEMIPCEWCNDGPPSARYIRAALCDACGGREKRRENLLDCGAPFDFDET